MLSKEMLEKVSKFSERPALFEKGTANIWTDPYIAGQMLQAHLDKQLDAASRKEESINQAVEFINRQIKARSRILDLGCGPGLYAERLCRRGHQVTGIDFSQNSINYARKSAEKQGLAIDYVYHNIFDIAYDASYDVALQIYGEINTFSDKERDQLLALVHKARKPEGIFIFDITAPIHSEKSKAGKSWSIGESGFWSGKSHMLLEESFEYEDHIWVNQYILVEEDEVKVYRNWFHDYTKESIKAIVSVAGFTHVQVLEHLIEEGKDEKGKWLTVIAQK